MGVNEGSHEVWKSARESGHLDQAWTADADAATHASKWFEGTKHLHDPETQAKIQRVVKMAQRGMITMDETNHQMSHLDPSYPHFAPSTSPHINIPDHLGDQFR